MKKEYSTFSVEDFQEGQIILIDKPFEWTSFDVVNKVRYAIRRKYNLKKIKVGHAGTLDPLATGLLILCTGRFTKKITTLTLEDKSYTGVFTLGATTPSHDLETPLENPLPFDHITKEDLTHLAKAMIGVQEQMPPIFSAKKVNGKRAYDAARKGEEVKLNPNRVEIKSFAIDRVNLPEVHFSISVSKGTYIRSIARDMGEALKTGAHLSRLRRESVGGYSVLDAMTPEAFQSLLVESA